MKVKELMTTDPIVAEIPGKRDEVLRLLLKHDVSGLPVVKTKTRELAGVITRSDIFRAPEEEQVSVLMSSKPHTVGPTDDVAKASRLFFEKRIHGLPVVEGKELVGVISPTDILRTITNGGESVDRYMVQKTSPVHTETPIRVVWEIMRLNHENALPVLDDKGHLAGIVADSDLFKLSKVDDDIRLDALGNAREDDAWVWDRISSIMPLYYARSKVDLPKVPVSKVMVKDVLTVFQKASLADAAKKMAKAKVNQLPVLDGDDRLVGVVSDLDLMQAKF